MQSNKENIIVSLTFEFALGIIEFTGKLRLNRQYNMAGQLFRAGISIGANIREAQNAESKNDFIHKMKIAAKETDETEYWLLLCKEAENYPSPLELIEKVDVIHKIISKIISSSKLKPA